MGYVLNPEYYISIAKLHLFHKPQLFLLEKMYKFVFLVCKVINFVYFCQRLLPDSKNVRA